MSTTDEKSINLIDSFYSPLTKELGKFREQCEKDEVPIILKETEMCLNTLLSITKPKNILEIGTAHGYSACYFANACADAKITSIERSPHMYKYAIPNIKKMGLDDRIKVNFGQANDILNELILDNSNESKFDFVFIDAAKSHYREFLEYAEKLTVPGSVVVCDNIFIHGFLTGTTVDPHRRHRTSVKRMNEFIEYLKGRKDLTISLLGCGDGLAIIKIND